jgi:hypothetical protein
LNDRCEGALEALAWVQNLLERALIHGVELRVVKAEVDVMKEKAS